MKKPNIIVNEIEVSDDQCWVKGGTISINGEEFYEDDVAPLLEEMIDALIMCKKVIEDSGAGFYPDEYEQLIEALKKAGCTE